MVVVNYSENNCIIEKSTKTLVLGCKNSAISKSITNIGSGAFKGCTDLTTITIPDSVTSIGASAFSGCTGLTSIIYKGITADWKNINKGYKWNDSISKDCIIHCIDGDIEISE